MEKKGPDFLCIGMPKCGTSTLDHLLKTCTDIYLPPVKEIHLHSLDRYGYGGTLGQFLFSKHWMARQERLAIAREVRRILQGSSPGTNILWILRFLRGKRDKTWYFNLFPGDRYSGVVTPSYHVLKDHEIHALSQDLPAAKIIIMLRNPLHQLWSHLRMSARDVDRVGQTDFFEDQLRYQMSLCASYADLVTTWQRFFPRSTGVFFLEDLERDQPAFLRTIIAFLGEDSDKLPQLKQDAVEHRRVNVGVHHDVPAPFMDRLQQAARLRLAGFDAIDKKQHDLWMAELDACRMS